MTRKLSLLVRVGWKAIGFGLVFIALSATAHAVPPASVPEIDPGSALSALTLLSGGLLILVDRRRTK